MARTGRPIEADPKLHRLNLRLTDSEYKAFNEFCKSKGMSKSDGIRTAIEAAYEQMCKKKGE